MNATKVLLVDDEERFLLTTGKLLEKKGFAVITATSGSEALTVLDFSVVHVVILDVKMPGMDGITALKVIKHNHPLVEVIMLTGHATVETAVEGLKSGASDFVMKPADLNELIPKINEAFKRYQDKEKKINATQAKQVMKSPRDILKDMGQTNIRE